MVKKKIGRKSKSSENNIIELSTPFAISNARAHHANSDNHITEQDQSIAAQSDMTLF